jgi:hypothetical protein
MLLIMIICVLFGILAVVANAVHPHFTLLSIGVVISGIMFTSLLPAIAAGFLASRETWYQPFH